MSVSVADPNLVSAFSHASKRGRKRITAPFSIRLSAEEKAYLQELAGKQALGAYIRDSLLAERAMKRRVVRRPKVDEKQLAVVLASLGDSRLASNLNQIAYHANTGTIDVSEDLAEELQDAYKAVIEMRDTLLSALGLRERQEA